MQVRCISITGLKHIHTASHSIGASDVGSNDYVTHGCAKHNRRSGGHKPEIDGCDVFPYMSLMKNLISLSIHTYFHIFVLQQNL